MQSDNSQLGVFQREYLWELSIPEKQLSTLAESIPAEVYGWRPAEDARAFSAVLVHVAAGSWMLLYCAEVRSPEVLEWCGPAEGEGMSKCLAMVHKSLSLEKAITDKAAVIFLLKRSFAIVREAFMETTDKTLAASRNMFGEKTTLRRIYMRMLAHAHEHMGQAIAYARCMGFQAPWPDYVKEMERIVANTRTS